MMNSTLEAALRYAALGYKVFPCAPGLKTPFRKGWQETATSDPEILKVLFSDPSLNIGWAVPESMAVLDIDKKKGVDGFRTLENLESNYGPLPASPNQQTPSGGNHLIFSLPEGITVSNSVGKVGTGLDVRSSSGYILLEPSIVDGRPYEWGRDAPWDVETPVAPNWLIDLAKNGNQHKATPISATFGQGERNSGMAALAGAMRKRGMSEDGIYAALKAENATRCRPPLEEAEIRLISKSISRYAPSGVVPMARPSSDWQMAIEAASDPGEVLEVARDISQDESLSRTEAVALLKRAARVANVSLAVLRSDITAPTVAKGGEVLPVVQILRGDFAGMVDRGEQLLTTMPTVFQAATGLVEVTQGVDGGFNLHPVTGPHLLYLLAKGARWQNPDGNDGQPPSEVVSALLARAHWPVRPLLGLLPQPTLTREGVLLNQGGYIHEVKRVATYNPADFKEWTGTPGEALEDLRGLLKGFAFRAPLDESVALAAILSAVLRPTLEQCPAYAVLASEPGSGKTTLARLVSLFAGPTKLGSWDRNLDERKKSLLVDLIAARACTIFDNVQAGSTLDDPTLAAILTHEEYTGRLLSVSRDVTAGTRMLWIFTGNNLKPGGDLARRIAPIHLAPGGDNIISREFDFDPLETVKADRAAWVMRALAVAGEGVARGEDGPALAPVASYSDWSARVRRVLVMLGLPDPAGAVFEAVSRDDDKELLSVLLPSWFELFGLKPVSIRQVLQKATGARDGSAEAGIRQVFEEVAAERGELNLRRLGHWLAANEGRAAAGLKLAAMAGKGRDGKLWALATA